MRKFILDLAGRKARIDNREDRPDDRRGQHPDKGGGQHPGLLLQRYLCENATGEGGNPEEKRAILQAAINAATNDEARKLYSAAFGRWSASLPENSVRADVATPERDSRLIVGLGSENVLETGIRLHHTYGMPIIPGSALKGLAAHYCDSEWGCANKQFKKPKREDDEAYRKSLHGNGPKPADNFHRLLFGNTDDGGCVVFHDAWITPDSPQPLVLDVMTPHHSDYNRDPADPKFRAPTDFDSPTPVPFLSARGIFLVAVSWHGPDHDEANRWTQRAKELLCDALQDWGIGGKTSSGYGRLVEAGAIAAVPSRPATAARSTPSKPKALPHAWQTVDATIVPDPKGQGRLFARHDDSGLVGPIQKSADVPEEESQLGAPLKLIVAMISADGKQIQFVYPTPANQQRAQQAKPAATASKTRAKGGAGGQRPRGGR